MITVDKTLVGWRNKANSLNIHSLSNKYKESTLSDYNLLKNSCLPVYDDHLILLDDFTNNYNWFANNFIHKEYYLLLIPKKENLNKYSLVGFSKLREGYNFIQNLPINNHKDYLIKLSEFSKNVYGGSIMIDENILVAEINEGLQKDVSYGVSHVSNAILTAYQPSVRYKNSSNSEKVLLWRAIKCVKNASPQYFEFHSIRDILFPKGYFEFAYIEENKHLRIVFIDVKNDKDYYNLKNLV